MKCFDSLCICAKHIRINAGRSLLTALGIAVGTAAVIAVLSIGAAAQSTVETELAALGVSRLYLYPDVEVLSDRDAEALSEAFGDEASVAVQAVTNSSVIRGGHACAAEISGTTAMLAQAEMKELEYGRFINESDERYSRKNIVLAGEMCEELFGNSDPVGKSVELWGTEYTVVGVEEERTSVVSIVSAPRCYIPLSAYRRHTGEYDLSEISVGSERTESFGDISDEAVELMTQRHSGIKSLDMAQQMETAKNILGIFRLALAAIAGVSLVVGGIGIMNMMLLTVRERTREIGVRKAIGATESEIMTQFLAEALMYALMGAAAGIVLGAVMTAAAAEYIGIPARVTAESVAVSAAFAAAVGIGFGALPAKKAASLRPVIALRR